MNERNGLRPQDFNGHMPATPYPDEPTNRDLLNQIEGVKDKLQRHIDESNTIAAAVLAKLERIDANTAKDDQ